MPMPPKNLDKIISLLKKEVEKFDIPIATKIGDKIRDPFRVLISCILSLRTKDTTTGPACERLFKLATTPQKMLKLPNKKIEKAIFPVGFYPTKARYIKATCRKLIEDYNSEVPDTMYELMEIIPHKYWYDLNNLLVAHGQNICLTNSPFCSKCSIRKYCPRIGVIKAR